MQTISIRKSKLTLDALLSIVPQDVQDKEGVSYFVFVRFNKPNLRGSEIHKKVTEVVGGYFSPRFEPMLLAPPHADISHTPKGRFDQQVEEGVGFLIDIKSQREIDFTYRCR